MLESRELLFARLKGFYCDPKRLLNYYLTVVAPTPSTRYNDNGSNYVGWSLTSRDGTVEDGVQQISLRSPESKTKGTIPSPLCVGEGWEVLNALRSLGLGHYRARIMKMEHEGRQMSFHVDARSEAWRLHIPIITNPHSFFEWDLGNGHIESVNIPADGGAWLVRVDILHRAVNNSPQLNDRVHLLMSLDSPPESRILTEPVIRLSLPGHEVLSEVSPSDTNPSRVRSQGVPQEWQTIQAATRQQLLRFLPQGGIVAEVGVFQGEFSRKIFDITQPSKLHLIDPWVHQNRRLWKSVTDSHHADSLRTTHLRMIEEIRSGKVVVHQGFSLDVLQLFPDHYFDWVYLDGDHCYENVLQELDLCAQKVKPHGLIVGHDFIKPEIYPIERKRDFGVVPAVREFCSRTNWQLVFQTPDQPPGSSSCPTFVLSKCFSGK